MVKRALMPACVAQRDGRMGLAHAAGAHQHDVLGALDKGEAGQLLDLAPLEAAGKAIAEVLERLERREACQAREHALLAALASGRLGPQHVFEEVAVGQLVGGRLLGSCGVALGGERQAQRLAECLDRRFMRRSPARVAASAAMRHGWPAGAGPAVPFRGAPAHRAGAWAPRRVPPAAEHP